MMAFIVGDLIVGGFLTICFGLWWGAEWLRKNVEFLHKWPLKCGHSKSWDDEKRTRDASGFYSCWIATFSLFAILQLISAAIGYGVLS